VDRATKYTCETIKGARNVHLVMSVGAMHVNKLLKKNLACFYYFCVDNNFTLCENMPWTHEWEMEVLISNSMGYVRHVMEEAF